MASQTKVKPKFYSTQYYTHREAEHFKNEKFAQYLQDPNANKTLCNNLIKEAKKDENPEKEIDSENAPVIFKEKDAEPKMKDVDKVSDINKFKGTYKELIEKNFEKTADQLYEQVRDVKEL